MRRIGQRNEKQNFLHGALNLGIATAVVKVISALYKIPIQRILSEAGAAHFAIANSVYATIFVLATAGLPVAVSKMVSESEALGNGESRRIFQVARTVFLVIGLFFSTLMLLGAKIIAGWMVDPMAVWAIRTIAPSILLIGLICPYRGYYQGKSNMTPTAVSQVIESLGKLIFGVGLTFFLLSVILPEDGTELRQLQRDEYGAAAAVLGVTLGLVICVLYMLFRGRNMKNDPPPSAGARGRKAIAKEMIAIAIPVTLGSAVLSVTNLIDTGLVRSCLLQSGLTESGVNLTTGSYSYAVTLHNLPQAFILTLAISLLPAIAAHRIKRNFEGARRTIRSALRVTALLGMPMAAGLSCLAGPVLTLLYGAKEGIAIAAPLLTILGAASIFTCIVTVTNAILQALGLIHLPIITMLLGCAAKVVCTLVLVPNPDINILGAPIGTLACFALTTLLNLLCIIRITGKGGPLLAVLVKPLLSALGMGVVIPGFYFMSKYVLQNLLSLSRGGDIATILAIGAGVLTYAILLILLKGLPKEDVELLPGGKKIVKILRISE